jgi:hypothetical protein
MRDGLTGFFWGPLAQREWQSQYCDDTKIWHYLISFKRRNRKRRSRPFWMSSNVKPMIGISSSGGRISKVVCEVKKKQQPFQLTCEVCGLVPVSYNNNGLCTLCLITRKHFERRAHNYLSVLRNEGKSLYVKKADYLDWCTILAHISQRFYLFKHFLKNNQPPLEDVVSNGIAEAIGSSPKAQHLLALLLTIKLERNTERKINGKPTETDITSTSIYRWLMLKFMGDNRELGCGNGECGERAI